MTNRHDRLLLKAPWLHLWAVLLVGFVAVLDNWTGIELSFSIFFLFPVAAVAWWGSWPSALAISVLSALAWLAADAAARDFDRPLILVWNTLVRFGFFVVVAALLGRIARSLQRERELARTDSLTGLANARWFYDFLAREIERVRRSGRSITLAYVDLDNFKSVNDTLGHPTGDRVLQTVSRSLGERTRRADVIARLGGDEFVLLLPDTDPDQVRAVIERTVAGVQETLERAQWPVTLSVGVVTVSQRLDSAEQLIKRADDVMYRAKASGKNKILFEIEDAEPTKTSLGDRGQRALRTEPP